jgi:hypothetical protein
MKRVNRYLKESVKAVAAALIVIALASTVADAKKLWKKQWAITVTVPDSITGAHFGTQSFTIRARNFDEPPSPLPLRKLTATAVDGASLQGVWRQEGKDFSLTFELPCQSGAVCGTVILRGRFPAKKVMSGKAYVMWDTRDRDNRAGFETVNGTFEGVRQ